MKVIGLKEVKKGAKLIAKKQKIESEILKLSKQYREAINQPKIDDEYFIALAEDYLKRNLK